MYFLASPGLFLIAGGGLDRLKMYRDELERKKVAMEAKISGLYEEKKDYRKGET